MDMRSSGWGMLEHPYATYLTAPHPHRTPSATEIPENVLGGPSDWGGNLSPEVFPDLSPLQAIPYRYEYVGLATHVWDYLHHLGIGI